MNFLSASQPLLLAAARALRRAPALCLVAVLAATGAMAPAVHAATALADQPIFATANVPGNLALALSVEFPTAISVAHTNRTYAPGNQYLGYFDPDKCYTYYYTDGTSVNNYFVPDSLATNHVCSGKWSGNFLNWAMMQTIDPFRWALTGGYRVIDTATLTVLEKAWATGQGSAAGNFPYSSIDNTTLAGATPFGAPYSGMSTRIWGLGNKMRFSLASNSFSMQGQYYNSTNLSGGVVFTRTDYGTAFIATGVQPKQGTLTVGNTNGENYSVSWTGTITAPATGTYSFQTVSDDGVRLYVNGTLVINNFTDHGPTTDTGTTVSIAQGSTITIRLDYYQRTGGAVIDLKWMPPGATAYSAIGSTGAASMDTASIAFTGNNAAAGISLDLFARVKVCDPGVGIETVNCTQYGSNYKPEGLMQKYANKIRYSAFGYLNDGNIRRDGGVLRAQQKFAGPTKPVPGSTPVTNSAAEWDGSTGVFALNPDKPDADATAAIMGVPSGSIVNSGVLNYLNKFGEITPGSYKTYDNVSELYYAAIRYFKNLPAVPEWTSTTGSSANDRVQWTDGFPVITAPVDPILYTCQRNFILGIGDVNTHADKNVPGNTNTANEPAMPSLVSGDTSVDAVDATNKLGVLETVGNGSLGGGSLGTVSPYNGTVGADGAISGNGCCNNNSALIAGLAYDAHVKDIRGRPKSATLPVPQTIDTYWVDVQEGQVYKNYNQFYLATKYGGFTVPDGYDINNTTPLPDSAWHTNTDLLSTANKRPDNYFSGGRPDLMKAGLDAAFAKIANSIGAYTTSFSTALPQIASSGNSSFSAQYDGKNWTGELTASSLSFDTSASTATLTQQWKGKKFTDILSAQIGGTGWDTNRRVLSWAGTAGTGVAFRASGTTKLATSDLALLDPSFTGASDATDYLNYLRGDQSNEIGASGGRQVYRARTKLLGDVVGSKVNPVGPPSFLFSDATNPGYAAFKSAWATRRTVIYFGSNDGMMHAVNGALTDSSSATPPLETDANYGKEMFAYVPRALFNGPTAANTDGLASLGNPNFVHHFMVDATPSVNDIDFARVPNASGAKQNPAATASDWRSVLIGGLGKGGKAYYALDVTDPVSMATSGTEDNAAAKVLWEFTDTRLGFTYGDPLVLKTKKYGWVVVFFSGYNNADGKGYIFFVNPKTGALLEQPVSTNTGSTSSDAGLAHGSAFIVDSSDGTADAIYAGDLLGNVWRLDVTSTSGLYSDSGKLVKFAALTDASNAGNPQPVTSRPSIEVSPSDRKRYVMIGTGRLLDSTDVASTQGQTFYTFVDGTNAAFNPTPFVGLSTPTYPIVRGQLTENTDVTDKLSFDPGTKLGWFEELGIDPGTPANPSAIPPVSAIPSSGIAFRIVSDLTTASGSVAFASTLPNGSVCSPSGISRIYARDFSSAQTTLDNSVSYSTLTSVATDLQYVSIGGKLRLLAGTRDGGNPQIIPITPGQGFGLRRLNWRELQVVD